MFSLVFFVMVSPMTIQNCYFIREQFFLEHPNFQKMLDPDNVSKQSKRIHICIKVDINTNTFYIPLRNNLGAPVRKFGRIGYSVPSRSRPNAGLDFRYAIVINDVKYIESHTVQKIPHSQYAIISNHYEEIKKLFSIYLNGYKKAARKGRIQKEPLYRESSLINFCNELDLV